MQSSAYVPWWEHGRRSNRGSRATLRTERKRVRHRIRTRAKLEGDWGIRHLPQGHPELDAKFLQFAHNAVCHTRYTYRSTCQWAKGSRRIRMACSRTFGVKAIHHTLNEFHPVLKTEVDEVGVDENPVRWYKGGIVREEHRGSDLRSEPGRAERQAAMISLEIGLRTHSRLILASFSASSFFFCFSWFSFLRATTQVRRRGLNGLVDARTVGRHWDLVVSLSPQTFVFSWLESTLPVNLSALESSVRRLGAFLTMGCTGRRLDPR